MLYVRHASSLEHDPRALAPEHPDTPERIEAIEAAMQAADWLGCERLEAPPASESELTLVHAPEHVRAIRELCSAGGGEIDAETFVGEASYGAALHAAGGACAMVRALLAREASTGFCALRPAGHHAERERAMGFCLFNNVAIAAELAIRELGVGKVLIIDWDVHHGNGTAEIFRRRADVLFASIHQAGLFPGTGAITDAGSGDGLGFTINVPVRKGSDEEVWLSVLEHVILPAGLEFHPELVLVSAGFDAHRDDPLGTACSRRARSRRWRATCATWPSRSARPSVRCWRVVTIFRRSHSVCPRRSPRWVVRARRSRSRPTPRDLARGRPCRALLDPVGALDVDGRI